MNTEAIKSIRNIIILSLFLTILFIATGVMPYFLKLAYAAVTGDTVMLVAYGVGAPGVVLTFIAGLFGILIAFSPILVPLCVVYWLLKVRNTQTKDDDIA